MDEAYVEQVLALVERIPPGRVMSYGEIASYLGDGGPRRVARVLSTYGGAVPWWRVVTASGRLPPGHEVEARRRLAAEGAALDAERVRIADAGWAPPGDGR